MVAGEWILIANESFPNKPIQLSHLLFGETGVSPLASPAVAAVPIYDSALKVGLLLL